MVFAEPNLYVWEKCLCIRFDCISVPHCRFVMKSANEIKLDILKNCPIYYFKYNYICLNLFVLEQYFSNASKPKSL